MIIGPGKPHDCSKSNTVHNIVNLAMEKGLKVAEQVSSEILRVKMKQENLDSGSSFNISTAGHPLSIKVGRPEVKTDRVEVQKLSLEAIKELCLNLNLQNGAAFH